MDDFSYPLPGPCFPAPADLTGTRITVIVIIVITTIALIRLGYPPALALSVALAAVAASNPKAVLSPGRRTEDDGGRSR